MFSVCDTLARTGSVTLAIASLRLSAIFSAAVCILPSRVRVNPRYLRWHQRRLRANIVLLEGETGVFVPSSFISMTRQAQTNCRADMLRAKGSQRDIHASITATASSIQVPLISQHQTNRATPPSKQHSRACLEHEQFVC